ncbi:MAG: serine hydrolase, partial [Planctomycetes bacterium]|nr:serine hydrolase [Planctomycetota bacterium]
LAQKIAALLVGFEGEVGVYVKHLARGDEVAIRADDVFPTASLVKVPILLRLFDRVDRGELGYHDEFAYDASKWDRGGEDLASRFRDGVEVPLSKLVMLMITTSDNTASLWCQDLAGTGTAVNAWLSSNGFEATRVNSRTAGREAAYAEWGWGQTTPREMARFLVGVRRGEFVSKAASEEMYRCLTRMYWNDEALAFVPPWVCAAAK